MKIALTDVERQYLRPLQKQPGDKAGYVKGTVIFLLSKGRSAGSPAAPLGGLSEPGGSATGASSTRRPGFFDQPDAFGPAPASRLPRNCFCWEPHPTS